SFGGFGTTPFRLGDQNRARIPAFYSKDEHGGPLSAWLCHVDDGVARRTGAPMAYDFGAMRENWLHHMLTDRIGREGFLHKTHVESRRQNFMGDTQWCGGQVVGKSPDPAIGSVDVSFQCANQRGEVTTVGTASVLLPSRAQGRAALPVPSSSALEPV